MSFHGFFRNFSNNFLLLMQTWRIIREAWSVCNRHLVRSPVTDGMMMSSLDPHHIFIKPVNSSGSGPATSRLNVISFSLGSNQADKPKSWKYGSFMIFFFVFLSLKKDDDISGLTEEDFLHTFSLSQLILQLKKLLCLKVFHHYSAWSLASFTGSCSRTENHPTVYCSASSSSSLSSTLFLLLSGWFLFSWTQTDLLLSSHSSLIRKSSCFCSDCSAGFMQSSCPVWTLRPDVCRCLIKIQTAAAFSFGLLDFTAPRRSNNVTLKTSLRLLMRALDFFKFKQEVLIRLVSSCWWNDFKACFLLVVFL